MHDKQKMLQQVADFLNMSAEDKENFAIGRRLNYYFSLSDMQIIAKKKIVEKYIFDLKENGANLDEVCNMLRSEMI